MKIKDIKKAIGLKEEIILDDLARGPNYFEVIIGGKSYKFISLTANKVGFELTDEVIAKLFFFVEADSYPQDIKGYFLIVIDDKNRKFWNIGWNWASKIREECKQITYKNKKGYRVGISNINQMQDLLSRAEVKRLVTDERYE